VSDPIDIFQVVPDGVRWLESAESVESARSRVVQLAKSSSDEYIVLDQKSGKKYVIKLTDLRESRRKLVSPTQPAVTTEVDSQL